MSRSKAPTVAVLKQRLEALGLPTNGLKAELVARLEAARTPEEQPNPSDLLMKLPKDIRQLVGRKLTADEFYFSSKIEQLNKIDQMEVIFPTALEWDVGTGSVRRAVIASKEVLEETLERVMGLENLKSVTMKRDHLTVRVVLNIGGRMEVQVLLVYPGIREAAYELRMHTAGIPYHPGKPLPVDFAQFIRRYRPAWSPTKASLEDAKKALKDILLGVHWIRRYVANGFTLVKEDLLLEQNIKLTFGDLTADPMQDTKDAKNLQQAFRVGLKRVMRMKIKK